MFWQSFYALCQKLNMSPNAVAKELSISSGAITSWKNGRVPSGTTLQKIADYFEVSTDYLLGKEDTPSRGDVAFTPKEAELLRRMQDLDEDQAEQLLQYMEFLISQRKKKDGE